MKTRILISFMTIAILALVLLPINTQANVNQQLDFDNTSDRYLFNLSNMKPGDLATRNLEIQNPFEDDFIYNPTVHFKGGSKKLYQEFELMIWDEHGDELYTGKLHEFEGFSPRLLASGDKEVLTFEATFPYELGNEYQGLGFEFELRFTIEGTNSSPRIEPDLTLKSSKSQNAPTDQNLNIKPEPNSSLDSDPVLSTLPTNSNPIQIEEETPELDSNDNNSGGESDHDESGLGNELDLEEGSLNEEVAELPVDGQILPSTSTNLFNIMFFGVILLISGSGLYIIQIKRKRSE